MWVLSGPLCGMRWIKGSYVNGCWLGTYERDKAMRFVASLQRDMVVWDVGANVGYYSLIAARHSPAGQVVAFEPVPRNLRYLRRHISLNQVRVEVVGAALGTEDGHASFSCGSTVGSGHLLEQPVADDAGTIQVDVRGPASLLAEGVPAPDVVKMDIEGAEASVLPALLEQLEATPVVFLALHGPEARASCRSTLDRYGYSVEPIDRQSLAEADEWLCCGPKS